MHGETPMITIVGTGAVKAVRVVADDTGVNARANTNADMIAGSDASDVSPTEPADVTDTAADVRAAAKPPNPAM